MTSKKRFITTLFSVFAAAAIVCFGTAAVDAQNKGNDDVLYKVRSVKNSKDSVSVKRDGKNLSIVLEGFGGSAVLKANEGGVETCRTVIEHESDELVVTVSLPIPMPNTPCQMMQGFVSVKRGDADAIETEIEKVSGNDTLFRRDVEKALGKHKPRKEK